MDYISAKKTAEKWGISQRRVEVLCSGGRLHGAERIGNMWLIPKNAEKPIDGRTKAAKQQNKPTEYTLSLEPERVIGMVNGTMRIEFMPLTKEDIGRLHTVLRGDISADEMVRQLVEKHRRIADAGRLRV